MNLLCTYNENSGKSKSVIYHRRTNTLFYQFLADTSTSLSVLVFDKYWYFLYWGVRLVYF